MRSPTTATPNCKNTQASTIITNYICYSYRLMRQCWQHRPEERPRFTVLVDTLTRLHERLVEGNESSSSAEESEFEDEEPRYTIQQRGSGGRR